jgi:hypothetical protein
VALTNRDLRAGSEPGVVGELHADDTATVSPIPIQRPINGERRMFCGVATTGKASHKFHRRLFRRPAAETSLTELISMVPMPDRNICCGSASHCGESPNIVGEN